MTDTDMTQALGLAREIAAFAPTVQRIAEHLAAQRKVAIQGEHCAYRSTDGAMCAVGCLIPDELYESRMERAAADEVLRECPEILDAIGIDSHLAVDVLGRFQRYHDSGTYIGYCGGEYRNYKARLDEFEGKPDAELAEAIKADLNAIVTRLWEYAQW